MSVRFLSGPLPLAVLILGWAMVGFTADWPAIRGRGNNAHVEDLDLHLPWPESGPPILWMRSIGQGYSGFAVVGRRAFTQAQDHSGQFVLCLDLDTGETIWKTRYAPPWDADRDWPGPYGTPTWSAGRVYFAGCYGTVGCLDAEDGSLVWEVDAGERFEGEGYGFGYSASPLVEAGRVFLPIGGENASVIALDADDGGLLWASGSDPAGYTPCYPLTVDGRRQIISALQTVLVAHDPESGAELWRHRLKKGYNPHPSWPLYEEPVLYVSLAFRRGSRALELKYEGDEPHAELVWETDNMSNDLFSGVVLDGHVYGFDIHDPQTDNAGRTKGDFKCLNLGTGEEMWSTSAVGAASALTDGDHLILFDERGNLVVAEATPEGYTELARTRLDMDDVCWTVPSVADQRLLVRGTDRVACLFLGHPEECPEIVGERGPGYSGLVDTWLRRHHGAGFWSPAPRIFAGWMAVCWGILFVVAPLCVWPVRRAKGAQPWVVYGLVAGVGSVIAMPLLTTLWADLVFTWPAPLFVAIAGVVVVGVRAENGGNADAICARVAALVFCLFCYGFFALCERLHILVGWAFLVGLVPAWPLLVKLARKIDGGREWTAIWLLGGAAFVVYFAVSVAAFEVRLLLDH